MLAVTQVREALLALRRAGYTSTFLLTHRAGSSSPAIHTRLDSHTHHLVAGALAQGEQGGNVASPGFTLWSPSTNPAGEELLREVPDRSVLFVFSSRDPEVVLIFLLM